MFSEENNYTDPLIHLTKSLVKNRFSLHNYCATPAVAVMYSRNIPMAEKQIVCFQSKQSENMKLFLFLKTIIYIFEDIF